MSLRKSPTRTPAFLEANRANAKKSTGPRTARGKAWSRLNRLHDGKYSAEYMNFVYAMLVAPPGAMRLTVKAILESKEVVDPLFEEAAKIGVRAEIGSCDDLWWVKKN